MIIPDAFQVVFPSLAAVSIAITIFVAKSKNDKAANRAGGWYVLLLYLNSLLILLTISVFLNRIDYAIPREGQLGHISSYHASLYGFPLGFLEISSTGVSSFYKEQDVLVFELFTNVLIFSAILWILYYLFKDKLRWSVKKIIVLNILLVILLTFWHISLCWSPS